MQLSGVRPSVPSQQRRSRFDTMRAVPRFQPSDAAEHRLVNLCSFLVS